MDGALRFRGVAARLCRSAARRLQGPLPPAGSPSYSLEGEDRVLCRLFDGRPEQPGFYVDVGAHHPVRFSNTYLFYLLGWRGVNIDALPGSMEEFRRLRPRDENIEVGIAGTEGERTFHRFTEAALNTFSSARADTLGALQQVKAAGDITLRCKPLGTVLNEVVPTGTKIDFLSVDVEGLDLEVLASNDWTRFRPGIVLAEILDSTDLLSAVGAETSRFLESQGYRPIAKTVNTVFYQEIEKVSA